MPYNASRKYKVEGRKYTSEIVAKADILTPTVVNKIPEILQSRKASDMLLVMAVMLLGITSFGLGRLSAPHETSAVVLRAKSPHSSPEVPPGATAPKEAASPTVPRATAARGEYVASKTGAAYHLPWCSGAKRIKEENKVWFATKAEAEAAGYKPAGNCKGL